MSNLAEKPSKTIVTTLSNLLVGSIFKFGTKPNNTVQSKPYQLNRYVPVAAKFRYCHIMAFVWMAFSIFLSIPWVNDLGTIVGKPVSILIIAGIGYIPGYINAFMVLSLIFDRQPYFKVSDPADPVTVLIACRNEEKNIKQTISYISTQDYKGELNIIVVDNGSEDKTAEMAKMAAEEYGLKLKVINEEKVGKNNALNSGLKLVNTKYLITLDADTLLHKTAVRHIVSRLKSAPRDVCAVAGAVLVKNSRENFITRLQEWDYFLGIASIKRMQGLYQGTLVAQGAYSVYKTRALRKVGGWPDAIGEDIVLTWKFLKARMKVYFEPLSVAFTEVPSSLKHLSRQRIRWSRGMIEALKHVKPWQHPIGYVRYMTGINLVMPYLDIVYTFCWIPGLFLAFWGKFYIVGPATLFVIPLALMQNYILYRYQRYVFGRLGLKIRRNAFGFITYVLGYQMLMSPMSVIGYFQEVFKLKRVWK